jgi:hypothetical protein
VDIEIFRLFDYSSDPEVTANTSFALATNLPIPGYDVLPFPMNGQFFYNGDLLRLKADANNSVTATISFTLGQAEEYLED